MAPPLPVHRALGLREEEGSTQDTAVWYMWAQTPSWVVLTRRQKGRLSIAECSSSTDPGANKLTSGKAPYLSPALLFSDLGKFWSAWFLAGSHPDANVSETEGPPGRLASTAQN